MNFTHSTLNSTRSVLLFYRYFLQWTSNPPCSNQQSFHNWCSDSVFRHPAYETQSLIARGQGKSSAHHQMPHYCDHDQKWWISAALRHLGWAGREKSGKAEGNTELCLWGDLDEVAEQLPREIFVPNSSPGASGLKDFADWKSSKWRNGIWQGHNGQGGVEGKKLEPETSLTLPLCTSHIHSVVLIADVAVPGVDPLIFLPD